MILNNTRVSLCATISAVLSGAEHAQSILPSGVKASLYDTEQTQGRVYAPRSPAVLSGAEHAQSILLSGVKASLYVNEHKGEFMCREHASVISGDSCDI